jgi:hypothetical protein
MLTLATHYEIITGFKTWCDTNLPIYLAAVVAHIGAGFICPAPKESVLGYRDLHTATQYPFVCYVAASAPVVEPSGMRLENITIEVDTGIMIIHSKPDELEKQLLAYADAWENMIGENESIGGLVYFARRGAMDYGHGALGDKSAATLVVTTILEKDITT